MIGAVDKEGVVHSVGSVGSAEAVDLEEAVDREEAVVRRYLQKILMLNWRSITQRQCRSIDEIPYVYGLALYTLCYINCVLGHERTPTSLCISIIQLFRVTRKKRHTGKQITVRTSVVGAWALLFDCSVYPGMLC